MTEDVNAALDVFFQAVLGKKTLDVVALDGSEEVVIWRKFRSFTGRYVAHCHNLAHEDHSMMFGWNIV